MDKIANAYARVSHARTQAAEGSSLAVSVHRHESIRRWSSAAGAMVNDIIRHFAEQRVCVSRARAFHFESYPLNSPLSSPMLCMCLYTYVQYTAYMCAHTLARPLSPSLSVALRSAPSVRCAIVYIQSHMLLCAAFRSLLFHELCQNCVRFAGFSCATATGTLGSVKYTHPTKHSIDGFSFRLLRVSLVHISDSSSIRVSSRTGALGDTLFEHVCSVHPMPFPYGLETASIRHRIRST